VREEKEGEKKRTRSDLLQFFEGEELSLVVQVWFHGCEERYLPAHERVLGLGDISMLYQTLRQWKEVLTLHFLFLHR
jgi:hypothetical protein